ncbi:DUF1385 domain-containing protein [Candidatus Woesearchaeota archaeon]|nr:DUF1385 domain-containing protein [Candidatus Woesearchaeota archaeon]
MAGAVKKDLHIGGQAVFEGVMLKSQNNLAVVVRKPDNKFATYKKRIKKKNKFLTFPFIRGIVNLIEMLDIGIKTLIWSSNQVLDEDESLKPKDVFFMLTTSILLVILIFIIAPFYLTKLFVEKGVLFNLIDGVIRIAFFVLYVLVISLSKDVRTLFQYHGAEHKVVNCFENKKPVNLKNAKKYTTLHKRCGTSFIIVVLIFAIIIFSFITSENILIKIGLRILLIPVIASLSYEFIKIGAKHPKNFLFQIFIWPGVWLQKITTKEPTNKQLEVALKTIKVLLKMEKVKT